MLSRYLERFKVPHVTNIIHYFFSEYLWLLVLLWFMQCGFVLYL